MRWKRAAVVSVMVAALAAGATSTSTATAADERVDGVEDIYKALERDLGLSRKQAEELGVMQERAV
jgi:hypothetical protein